MRYLVLYKKKISNNFTDTPYGSKENHQHIYTTRESFWEEFSDKHAAIEFARQRSGVIVEAFEFDIKKGSDAKRP